jgi:hypothetical protein
VESITGWLEVLSRLNIAGEVNDPSLFVITSSTMTHLEPIVYQLWNGQTATAMLVSWGILAALIGYSFYLIVRSHSSQRGQLLDFALVSALTMIAVYHRVYDTFLMLPALIYVYLHTVELQDKITQRRWFVFLFVLLLIYFMPADLTMRLGLSVPFLQDNYLWRVIAPFQAWANLVLMGVLL